MKLNGKQLPAVASRCIEGMPTVRQPSTWLPFCLCIHCFLNCSVLIARFMHFIIIIFSFRPSDVIGCHGNRLQAPTSLIRREDDVINRISRCLCSNREWLE